MNQPIFIAIATTLFIAVLSSLFTQLIIFLIYNYREWKDRKIKKDLIISDLKNQKEIVKKLKEHLNELLIKFQKLDLNEYYSDSFQNMHTEIYQSISKPDLFKIFKGEIIDVVDIYKVIEFLKSNIPKIIYSNYLEKIKLHRQEKKDVASHEKFCATHIGFVEKAKKQILLNISTATELIGDIDKIIGMK